MTRTTEEILKDAEAHIAEWDGCTSRYHPGKHEAGNEATVLVKELSDKLKESEKKEADRLAEMMSGAIVGYKTSYKDGVLEQKYITREEFYNLDCISEGNAKISFPTTPPKKED